ncbi:hypothetical protein KFK09_012639 [Dendrobium nobile]|uniref:SWIM-type domain-containing protein n=1 Tax=Dendrobium nobile TaxID=94219 RepID=A0A8T3BJP1_DENNO|nr:hypothetical protein KFK09_012639 [Dendrobium nobile]
MQGAIVELDFMSCSCRRWELNGLSCLHECAAINIGELLLNGFVHNFYTVYNYRRTYEFNIMRINSLDDWPKSEGTSPLLSRYNKSKRGHPPMIRRRGAYEQVDNS